MHEGKFVQENLGPYAISQREGLHKNFTEFLLQIKSEGCGSFPVKPNVMTSKLPARKKVKVLATSNPYWTGHEKLHHCQISGQERERRDGAGKEFLWITDQNQNLAIKNLQYNHVSSFPSALENSPGIIHQPHPL